MIGGIAKNHLDSIQNTKSKWSIVEGDEYISARFDPQSKFFHYRPEFLLLTASSWEHTDIFKSSQDYIDNFKKLVKAIPENGIVVYAKNGENNSEVIKSARCKTISYELNKIDENITNSDWSNLAHKENKFKNELRIFNKSTNQEFSVFTELIGDHNRENILGCIALASELGIDEKYIIEAVREFKGIARRLEVKLREENLLIIDDHACSPPKVIGSLNALRQVFADWYITIIFEPNVGNRTKEALPLYKSIFKKADEVILPHFKPVKTGVELRLTANQLTDFLIEDEINIKYIPDDNKLTDYVYSKNPGKHIICFMGAYGFRGMIREIIRKYE